MYKWCSDCFSTLRENPNEEVDENDIIIIIIIIIMNKSQELTIFHGRQKLTSAKK